MYRYSAPVLRSISLAAALAMGGSGCSPWQWSTAGATPDYVWRLLDDCGPVIGRPEVLSCKRVDVNAEFLRDDVLRSLHVPIPDGGELEVVGKASRGMSAGTRLWRGSDQRNPYSEARFARLHDAIVGRVSMPDGGVLALRMDASQGMIVERINPDLLPPELPPRVVPPRRRHVAPQGTCTPHLVDGSKVLVVYTPKAEAQIGGRKNVLAWLELTFNEANSSYSQSNSRMGVVLAGAARVEYQEEDMNLDLTRLIDPGDTVMDDVHPLRKTEHADLVVLITYDGHAGGYASQFAHMHIGNTDFAPDAFAVVSWTALRGSYAFLHELGHLMGAQHYVLESGGTKGTYDYSYGHIEPEPNLPCRPWKTIMSGSTYCCACTQRLYWSNPGSDICRNFMGNSATEDNSQTLTDTAATMAGLHCGL